MTLFFGVFVLDFNGFMFVSIRYLCFSCREVQHSLIFCSMV